MREINKIFDNRNRKEKYLERLFNFLNILSPLPRSIVALNNCVMETWNYNFSKSIIRDMFFQSEKHLRELDCKDRIDYLFDDWYRNNLGNIE